MEVPHQIPKIIHYCWFGKTSLPEDAQRCIASWKKFCPDYEIVEWNETKINLSALPLYVQQAYAAQKWAFVADYVRLYALIRYGGVYMDTDVELVAPLDRFMNQAAFAGLEDASHVATCVMACEPEFPLFKEFLLQYSNMQFLNPDGTLNTTTNVSRLTDICLERGMLQNGQCQSVAAPTIFPICALCVCRRRLTSMPRQARFTSSLPASRHTKPRRALRAPRVRAKRRATSRAPTVSRWTRGPTIPLVPMRPVVI